MTATAPPTCHVVISLAHLLQQHSLSYDDEKNALLHASVKTVVSLSKRTSAATAPHDNHDNEATSTHPPEGEVHVVLTGSPRPTFAETNAWLLEAPGSPRGRRTSVDHAPTRKSGLDDDGSSRAANLAMPMELDEVPNATVLPQRQPQRPSQLQEEETPSNLMHDYIHESTPHSSTQNANMNDLCGSPTKTGGSVLTHFQNRKRSGTADGVPDVIGDGETAAGGVASSAATTGPMVGHAVVNAISQTKGLGLHSSRSRLLQGTIDRPLWDQRRWTDGECLFSELVDRVGLESFENVGVVGGRVGRGGSAAGGVSGSGGADDAAGGGGMGSVRRHVSTLGEVGHDLDKTTNISAHLITVPAVVNGAVQWNGHVEIPGMDESTMEEIARGILRCLKRKKSPPVSKVYLALPPLFPNINANAHEIATDGSTAMEVEGADVDRARRELAVKRLSEAWEKLEQYNDMIGQPKLMAGVDMEFVRVDF